MRKEKEKPKCSKCNIELTDENWYLSHKKEHRYICRKCYRIKHNLQCQGYRQRHRKEINQKHRELLEGLRDNLFSQYGQECACCGETRREYLTIDHKNGGGRKHRRELELNNPEKYYKWLIEHYDPSEFQILCFNCNCGKGNYSVCPHDKDAFGEEFEAKHKTPSSKSIWKLQLNVIKGYGGKCELCGEDNPHFLTIDHKNGEGAKERKEFGDWRKLYRKLRDENYPRENYRLLCYNCNCALGCNRITEEKILKQNKWNKK